MSDSVTGTKSDQPTGQQKEEWRNRSFSRSLSQLENLGEVKLNCWERFLSGQIVCSCCAYWTFLTLMLVMTFGGFAGGLELLTTGGEVLTDDTVQLFYAQKYLVDEGCKAGRVLDDPICRPKFGDAAARDSSDDDKEKSRVAVASGRSRSVPGNSIIVIYEATGTGCPGDECATSSKNLLTERNMKAMKKFEDAVFGAEDFQSKYCLLRYPSHGNATPVCTPPMAMLSQLFSGGEEVRNSTKELFDKGFGNVFGACLCSLGSEPCSACSSPAAMSRVVDCVSDMPASALEFIPAQFRSSNSSMRAFLTAVVGQQCADIGSEPCQYAAPFLSSTCSSSVWSQTTSGTEEPLQGDDLSNLLKRLCDPADATLSPVRRFALPSFVCDDSHLTEHGTPFMMSVWSTGHDGNNQDELEEEYSGKLWNTYQEAIKEAEKDTNGEMRPMMLTAFTALKASESLLIHDCSLAFGAFLIVFMYMWFTTETFFLSSMGMLQVLMSCPPAFFVWKVIYPDGVSFLQFLSIFMILGIGADDVFVLLDAWKQARAAMKDKGDPDQIFTVAYRRAFSAMLTTTTTTGAAFCFGAFSPIPAVSQFCLFAAIVVIFDFIWCITFFASSLRVFERFFMGRSCCCCGGPKPAGSCCGPGCCWGGLRALHRKTPLGASRPAEEGVDERVLERFCSGPLFNFVKRWRIAILVLWLAVTVTGALTAGLMLKTATKQPEIGDEENDVVRVLTIMREYFTNQEQQVVTVSWGLPEEEAATEFTSTNPITPVVANLGDRAEILTTPAGQQAMLELCESADAEGTRCDGDTCLVYGSGSQCTRNPNVWSSRNVWTPNDPYCTTGRYCFMEWVKEYAVHHSGGNLSFPVPQKDFVPMLRSEGFKNYLETREAANREAQRHWDNILEQEQTGWIIEDDKLKFAWVTFNASFKGQGPVEELNAWHDRWAKHVQDKAPATEARQSSSMYVFMVLQNELLSAAIQGIVVSLGVTAVILALVTFNWILALVGLVNISVITVAFLGVMPLIPWELGSNECIFLIAVVGLAVDYTVHLLHAYNEQSGSREERMRGALSTMGISVASGAITTMGAGVLLFMCDIAFFQQYGSFIFLVILISVLAALTNLPAMILLVGPEGGQGKIMPLYVLRDRLAGRRAGAEKKTQVEHTPVEEADPAIIGVVVEK